MSKLGDAVPTKVLATMLRAVYALPAPVRRLVAGPPIRLDGQRLAPDAQLLLRLSALVSESLGAPTVAGARANLAKSAALIGGPPADRVRTRQLGIPGADDTVPARLYEPDELPAGSPLLIFYHGGGWAIGDLDTHDTLCRFLAVEAGVRVLSVDYRLAPEHPFPAATEDAFAAFEYAVREAEALGVDPARIALGGDSAGGNLAAVTAHQAASNGGPLPAFLLLFYPGVDASVRRPSRELFGAGFYLTDSDMDWFLDQYAPDPDTHTDPRLSVLLADDLTGLPPTYVATAGFDPLRDEGEAFAARLAEAGVPVALRRHRGMFHGFANVLGLSGAFREPVAEAVGALRVGLALRR
ncbi:alpha/beta hydrolase [Solihabitans fulvus]|uniref:Alpha/beta hydrolase n=1 Tax=Solihabitans fulvus TaxID=1892852 RepID=A0A5B2XEL0_9PSEU|nr:alpha/beta hydrolase [Solihabitans fulvus]KAA2262228.1 alpha/beta hydrolase [Solihabitans fulvus]